MVELSIPEVIKEMFNPVKEFFSHLTVDSFFNIVLFGEFTVGNLFATIIIAAIFIFLAKKLGDIIRHRMTGKVESQQVDIIVKIVRIIILLIGLAVASPQLHIDISGLLVTGGVITAIVGFASQNTLSNLVAGVLLIIERPIKTGDSVIINGTEGFVEEIKLLSTRIRCLNGLMVRIPNATVFGEEITNCYSNIARRFEYHVDISYSEDAEKAISIIRHRLEDYPLVLTEPAPQIFVNQLGASGIDIEVRIWAPTQYWWNARIELLWLVFKDMRDANIDIPFDQLTVWFGEEEARKMQAAIEAGKTPEEPKHE